MAIFIPHGRDWELPFYYIPIQRKAFTKAITKFTCVYLNRSEQTNFNNCVLAQYVIIGTVFIKNEV